MSFRLKFLLFLFLGNLFLFPAVVIAAGVGFVPSSRLWFSSLLFPPKDFTNIYTVIINNSYFSLDAIIGFYIDGKLIDTAYINQLLKEQATQVKGSWWATEGNHTVAVRFIKAVAFDENGNRTELNVNEFNTVNNSAIQVGNSQPTQSNTTSIVNFDNGSVKTISDNLVTPVLNLKVEKNGDKLSIVEIKVVTTSLTKSDELRQEVEKKLQTAIQQGQEIGDQIVSAVGVVSSSLNTVNNAYDNTRSLLNGANKYWQEIKNNGVMVNSFSQKIKEQIKIPNKFSFSSKAMIWFFRALFFLLLFYFVRRLFKRRSRSPEDF